MLDEFLKLYFNFHAIYDYLKCYHLQISYMVYMTEKLKYCAKELKSKQTIFLL